MMILITFLNKHAPKKKKGIRGNNKLHVNKALRQAIMKRSKLKNKANKTKDPTDIKNYKKQRNYVVNLNKEAKLKYFSKYESDDNKPFWVRCKPYFTNKHSKADTDIMLSENGELILKNKEIANTFNDHFGSIVDNLGLDHWDDHSLSPTKGDDRIDNIIKRYKNHPSIKNIKAKFNSVHIFSFHPVSVDDVKTVIRDLKNNKSAGGEIPIQILKESEFTFRILTNCINKSIETGCFSDSLKAANITPIFKKDHPLDNADYRPVSILPLISKVYERLIYNQWSEYSESFLSHILCGFRKAHSTQHALFKLLQSWQKELDNRGFVGTILVDLSKAYDCIPHELLIAKLKCYGIGNGSLRLVLDYLTNRKQRTKIGSSFSSWCDINTGVPQGSTLGPLLFNIFINDLFFSITKSEVCNFADDNTLYSCNKNLEHVFSNLKYDLRNVLDWFKINSMTANPGKFQFKVLGVKNIAPFNLNVNGKIIPSSNEVKLLGITIDNQLKFKKHIEELCKKSSYKLNALRRIRGYLTVEKARILAYAFIDSQFNYAPLIWMFAGKTLINKICKIHHRTLQVVYNEYNKSYQELLQLNNIVSIHQRHLQYLALEVFKSLMHLNPEFMWSYFNEKPITYDLRKGTKVFLPPVKSFRLGLNSVHFRGSILWNNLPSSIKNSQTINEFKVKLKNLGNIHCTCGVCR